MSKAVTKKAPAPGKVLAIPTSDQGTTAPGKAVTKKQGARELAAVVAGRQDTKRPRIPTAGENDHHRGIGILCSRAAYGGSMVAAVALKKVMGGADDDARRLYAHIAADEMMVDVFEDVNPTNAIERMLVEQLVMTQAHVLAANHRAGNATEYDRIEQCLAMTSRLMADFRRTAAALKELRAPVRQFIVAAQVNNAGGDQTITGPGLPAVKAKQEKSASPTIELGADLAP